MARIRTIKPAFFSSLTIASLPKAARLTFVGLWCYCDDDGRGVDDARLIKAEVWPLDDDYGTRKIENDLQTMVAAGLIERYEIAGRRYLRVIGFGEHQRINRPQPSRLPPPTDHPPFTESSVNDHASNTDPPLNGQGMVTESSPPEGKGREKEGKGTVETKGGDNSQAADRSSPPQESSPPRKCPAHSHINGPGPPCGPCGDARREHDAWQQQHQVTPLDGTAAALRQRTETEHADLRSIVAEPPDPKRLEHVRQLRETELRRPPETTA